MRISRIDPGRGMFIQTMMMLSLTAGILILSLSALRFTLNLGRNRPNLIPAAWLVVSLLLMGSYFHLLHRYQVPQRDGSAKMENGLTYFDGLCMPSARKVGCFDQKGNSVKPLSPVCCPNDASITEENN